MINLNVLSQSDYNKLVAKLLEKSEADSATAYFDTTPGNKHVTIGRGFDIEPAGLARTEVFKVLGLGQVRQGATQTLTDAMNAAEKAYIARIVAVLTGPDTNNSVLQTALNLIMAERAADLLFKDIPSITGLTTFTMTPQQIEAAFTAILDVKEGAIDRVIAGRDSLVLSSERAALLSMMYQGLIPDRSAPLKAAIVTDSDRAEAWYLIRYEGAVSAPGDRGRHIAEAQIFGLYEGANTGVRTAGPSEARAIFAMLTRNHDAIVLYETAYGVSAVANAVSRFGVNAADVQFPSIYNPARDAFVAWENTGLPADKQINAAAVNPISIYYVPSTTTGFSVIDARDDDDKAGNVADDLLVGGEGHDRMIGGAGSDTLDGGAGNDMLQGGLGDDYLIGGAGDDFILSQGGNDTMDGGEGNDTYVIDLRNGLQNITIVDSDHMGEIVVIDTNGDVLNTLVLARNDTSTNAWKSDDGKVTISHNSPWKLTLSDGSVIQLGEGFDPSGFGMKLTDTQPTTATYLGDFIKKLIGSSYVITEGNYVDDGEQANAADVITGSAGADSMQGFGGNDALAGMNGDDFIDGGVGDDLLLGGLGADTLNGGAGKDYIFGGGTGGLVYLTGTGSVGPVAPGPEYTRGFSWVTYNSGIDISQVGTYTVLGADALSVANDASNVIDGGAGGDTLLGGSGADVVHGGDDKDSLEGLGGDDALSGDGSDFLRGASRRTAFISAANETTFILSEAA